MGMIIEDYSVRQGTICFLAGLSDIIQYLGTDISEDILLGICQSLSFCYGYVGRKYKDQWYEKGNDSDIYFYCTDFWHEFKMYETWGKEVGLSISQVCGNNEREAFRDIEVNLNRKIPVLAEVDTYYLPYHINYKEKHDAHTIVIYGIDYASNKCYIADNYITTLVKSCFKGEVPYKEFRNSLNLEAALTDYNYIHWNVLRKNAANEPFILKPAHIRESFAQAEYKMHKCKSDNSTKHFGVEGIRQLQKDILEFCDSYFDSEIENQLTNIHCFITGYGGPIPTRMLYLSFLQNSKVREFISNVEEAITHIESEIKQWRIVANTITRCIFCKNNDKLKGIEERMNLIIQQEEETITALKQIIF